ncbi:hypothetical protein J6590_025557 [Homalodisca vitripennis]|nr:hypothetical protein J6590_025557 [Homalodisca vitripennis]
MCLNLVKAWSVVTQHLVARGGKKSKVILCGFTGINQHDRRSTLCDDIVLI